MSGPKSRVKRLRLALISLSLVAVPLSCGGDDGTTPEQPVRAELLSNGFSTSLIVADVDEGVLATDGGAGANSAQALLEAAVDETWLLIVTTFLEGESGSYRPTNQRVLSGE